MSRRRLIRLGGGLSLAAVLGTLSGCTGDAGGGILPRPVEGTDPDVRLILRAQREEEAVVAKIALVQATFPAMTPPLAPAARLHGEHVSLLASATPGAVSGPATAQASPPGTAVPPGPKDAAGARDAAGADRAAQALGGLVEAERRLTAVHTALALRARSGQLAQLLGALAAASAQQAQVIEDLQPAQRGRRTP